MKLNMYEDKHDRWLGDGVKLKLMWKNMEYQIKHLNIYAFLLKLNQNIY